MIIKAGTILTLEHGDFSDFAYTGPFSVIKDIDQQSVTENFFSHWHSIHPDFDPVHGINTPEINDAIVWLVREGFIQDSSPSFRWHVGYHNFNPDLN